MSNAGTVPVLATLIVLSAPATVLISSQTTDVPPPEPRVRPNSMANRSPAAAKAAPSSRRVIGLLWVPTRCSTRPFLAEMCGVRSLGGTMATTNPLAGLALPGTSTGSMRRGSSIPSLAACTTCCSAMWRSWSCKDTAQSALSVPIPIMRTPPPTLAMALRSSARSSTLLSCRLKSRCRLSLTCSLTSRWIPAKVSTSAGTPSRTKSGFTIIKVSLRWACLDDPWPHAVWPGKAIPSGARSSSARRHREGNLQE